MADARITKIRTWMAAEKIDAFLVPHADRFQSEYLPPRDERLAWLTGFTGSAGMAAILPDHAVLYVSGIYTLQASLQIDTDSYDIVESPPQNPVDWLAARLPKKSVLAFDAELFTVTQMQMWQKLARQQDWVLRPLDQNPIDQFWTDRPAEIIHPAIVHDAIFSGATTAEKIEAILSKKSTDADYLLTTDPSLVCWLLNMRGDDVAHTPLVQSIALLDREGQVTLFVHPDKITPDLLASWGNHVAVTALDDLYPALAKIEGTIQIDPAQCPFALRDFFQNNDIPVIESADPAMLLRALKNATEIAGAVKAHQLDATAFREFITWFRQQDFVHSTITELDIVNRLQQARRNTGECIDESFKTIAGFAANGAIIHYRPEEKTNKTLKPGNLLLLDSGGQYRFGTTDITRVFAVGEVTPQMKTHYTAVLKGLIALSLTRFPVGTNGAQLDSIARAPIWAIGLDYAHGTGHGVGSYLSVHEGPQRITPARLSHQGATELQPGMILSIEPGIYLNGEYGIRLENLVVIIRDTRPGDAREMLAFQTLTTVPFEDALIDFDMLDEPEKNFLKQFTYA